MKKNLITLRAPLKLNLQMFADGGDSGNGDGTGTNGASTGDNGGKQPQGSGKPTDPPANPPADPDKPDPSAISFKSQSELDTLINDKIQAAQAQWQQSQEQQKDYDKMTPAEKQAFDLKKAQDDLAAEKQKTLSLTNKAALNGRLAVDQLPGGLIDVFENVLGADDKTIDAAYTKITGIFRDAVKSGVDQRLAGSAEKPGANGTGAEQSMGETLAQQRNSNAKPAGDNPWASKNSGAWGDKK